MMAGHHGVWCRQIALSNFCVKAFAAIRNFKFDRRMTGGQSTNASLLSGCEPSAEGNGYRYHVAVRLPLWMDPVKPGRSPP